MVQMSAVESSSRSRDALPGLTLHAALLAEKRQAAAQVNRTLLDIIRDEEPQCSLFAHNKDKKSWKSFRDRLLLKRAVHIPVCDNRIDFNSCSNNNNNTPSSSLVSMHHPVDSVSSHGSSSGPGLPRSSIRFGTLVPIQLDPPENSTNAREAEQGEEQHRDMAAREGTRSLATVLAEERALSGSPVRLSLMELLEESDMQMEEVVGSTHTIGGDDGVGDGGREMDGGDAEIEEGVEEGEWGGCAEDKSCCCVCMVRNKGAALIPCGHTFCRLCSRELWVQRGHCPLCNTSILEILYLF